MELSELIRPDLAALAAYTPALSAESLSARLGIPVDQIVKLDTNENPYGPSPRAIEALRRFDAFEVYPDPDQRRLRQAISAYIGQPIERIVCGNGSDELIDLLMRLFVAPGDAVVEAPPTFGMYSFNTGVVGGRIVQVPRDDDFAVDIEQLAEAVIDSRARLLFLAQPNNPDGGVLPPAAIQRLVELPTIVVMDEAYAEFSGTSAVDLIPHAPNLVVLRTFSKWAGLAGLRVGYGVMSEQIARHLWTIKPPFNVNMAAQVAAAASLEDVAYLRANVARIIAERERVLAELAQIDGLRPYPSQTNFLLIRVERGSAADLHAALEARGIMIRLYRSGGLSNCIRISIGTPAQNDRVLAALRDELRAVERGAA